MAAYQHGGSGGSKQHRNWRQRNSSEMAKASAGSMAKSGSMYGSMAALLKKNKTAQHQRRERKKRRNKAKAKKEAKRGMAWRRRKNSVWRNSNGSGENRQRNGEKNISGISWHQRKWHQWQQQLKKKI